MNFMKMIRGWFKRTRSRPSTGKLYVPLGAACQACIDGWCELHGTP